MRNFLSISRQFAELKLSSSPASAVTSNLFAEGNRNRHHPATVPRKIRHSSPICSMPDFEWCLAARDRIANSGMIASLEPSFSVEKTEMMRFLTKSDR